MTLSVKKSVEDNLHADATRPMFVVEHELSGVPVFASCSGDIEYAGLLYGAGGCKVVSISDSQSATLTVPATPETIHYVETGAWRKGNAKIYHIPGLPSDELLIYDEDDGVLIIDGFISTARYNGGNLVQFSVTHDNNSNKLAPRHTWDDLSAHVPAPNTELVWEGNRYILTTRDRAREVSTIKPAKRGKALTSKTIKDLSQPPNIAITITGSGVPIEVIYGERIVAGKIIALGTTGGGNLVMAVGWGFESFSIEEFYINGEAPPGGVIVTHYLGRYNQGVDATLAATIPAFNSDFVLRTAAGEVLGASYTVVEIPPGELTQSPTFTAILKGRAVRDPRIVGENDPQWSHTSVAYIFDGSNDVGPHALSGSIFGSMFIGGGYLFSFGNPNSAFMIEDHASMGIGVNKEFEIVIALIIDDYTLATEQVLCATACTGSSDYGWDITINPAGSLRFRASNNGVQNNLCNVEIADLSGEPDNKEHIIVVRRYNDSGTYRISATVNGIDTGTLFTSGSVIFDASSGISLGAFSDGSSYSAGELGGVIRYFRLTVGGYRAALLENGGSIISGSPFPEYAQYSDNSALCMADFIENKVFGVGVPALGVESCADFDDELLEGSFPRCQLSLSIAQIQSAMSYVDLLGEYAECFAYNEGRAIRMKPNKIIGYNEASGRETIENGSFVDDSAWTVGEGWVVGGGVAACFGTQTGESVLEQTFNIPFDVDYAVGVYVTRLVGTYSIEFCGNEYVSGASVWGEYKNILPGIAGTQSLRVIVDDTFIGEVYFVTARQLYHVETKFIKGSLTIEGLDDTDTPTSVTARYTEGDSSNPNWQEVLGSEIALPGVDTGEVPEIKTTLYVQGVRRLVEANNKANNRLARYVNPVRYSYETSDHGIRFNRGDVIQLRKDTHGIDAYIRCESVDFAKYGRYKLTGKRYSDDQHPSEIILPESTGVVPIGGIVGMASTFPPAGYQEYNAADGKFIIGAGGAYAVGASGGSDTHPGFSGTTDVRSLHDTGGDNDYPSLYTNVKIVTSGAANTYDQITPNTDHDHDYDTGVITPDPLCRRQRLMIKVGSAATSFPKEAQVFGLENVIAANVSRIVSSAGRLLKAANASANAGASNKTVSLITGPAPVAHVHHSFFAFQANRALKTNAYTLPDEYYDFDHPTGDHDHILSAVLSRNVKRRGIAMYGSTTSFDVRPGMMILWAGSIASIPAIAPWVLCDGTNGTYDLRDYFLEIAQIGGGGIASGDNTISLSALTSEYAHDHEGSVLYSRDEKYRFLHKNKGRHKHLIEASDSWIPSYYALAMIMYAPS